MYTFSVENILRLFVSLDTVRFYIFDKEDEYEFDYDEIPDEILYMKVTSIDNPATIDKIQPICINLALEDFDNYNAFKEEFKGYLV